MIETFQSNKTDLHTKKRLILPKGFYFTVFQLGFYCLEWVLNKPFADNKKMLFLVFVFIFSLSIRQVNIYKLDCHAFIILTLIDVKLI